jgi:hypothetical protein
MPMTDDELAKFLGIAGHPKALFVIAELTPEKRALYDRMAEIEVARKARGKHLPDRATKRRGSGR